MVGELDITDQDVTKIADMIDGEITKLVPEWKAGLGIEESPRFANSSYCHNCASNHTSNGSFMNFLSQNPNLNGMQISQCCGHGRFEEITYSTSSRKYGFDGANNPVHSSRSSGLNCRDDIWDQHESLECSSADSGESHSVEENETEKENKVLSTLRDFVKSLSGPHHDCPRDYEEEIQQELRWLKAKYQMELSDLRDQQLGGRNGKQKSKNGISAKTEEMVSPESLCTKGLLPNTPKRTKSLPVDAVDI